MPERRIDKIQVQTDPRDFGKWACFVDILKLNYFLKGWNLALNVNIKIKIRLKLIFFKILQLILCNTQNY